MSQFPHRGFRFGVQVSKETTAKGWTELARRTEATGYEVLTMPDHFTDQLAPVPALMAAANATTSLRVGALVFDNDYKHPVVLAKELATIDLLSDGRLDIGLGAGWMISDYEECHTTPPRYVLIASSKALQSFAAQWQRVLFHSPVITTPSLITTDSQSQCRLVRHFSLAVEESAF
jgi:hypothetical protein